jgi:hypothetical protein
VFISCLHRINYILSSLRFVFCLQPHICNQHSHHHSPFTVSFSPHRLFTPSNRHRANAAYTHHLHPPSNDAHNIYTPSYWHSHTWNCWIRVTEIYQCTSSLCNKQPGPKATTKKRKSVFYKYPRTDVFFIIFSTMSIFTTFQSQVKAMHCSNPSHAVQHVSSRTRP